MTKALTEAIELDPNNANSPFILRREYLINGDIDKDESEFLKSINLNNRLKMATTVGTNLYKETGLEKSPALF
jgi:hypothetical protein